MKENLRNHKRTTSPPYLESYYMRSKAGFTVSCEAQARRSTKEVLSLWFMCGGGCQEQGHLSVKGGGQSDQPLHCNFNCRGVFG